MPDVTLQQVLEALGKATPGEWHCSKNGRVVSTKNDTGFCRHIAENAWPSHPSGIADMEAIAIAVNWLRANAERLREFEQYASRREAYISDNPIGGPAVRFRAMAERIEAGEPYWCVLADFGFVIGSAYDVLHDDLEQLKARLHETERDAARWQYLRDAELDEWQDVFFYVRRADSPEAVNAAIDAAMAGMDGVV